ncbi:MAG TPA: MMPL family transporter [bacterium]|nr:MMPL family transporter [bacterium]
MILLRLFNIGIRFPRAVLVLTAVLTCVSILAAKKLHIENDLAALLPKQIESVRGLETLKARFAGLGHLLVVVESPESRTTERFAGLLEARLAGRPDVSYVEGRAPVDFFEKRGWLYIDLEDLREVEARVDRAAALEKKGLSPVFNGLMDFADDEDRIDLSFKDLQDKYRRRFGFKGDGTVSSEDGALRVLKVKLKSNPQSLDETRRFLADVRAQVERLKGEEGFGSVTVGYTGAYPKMLEQADLTRREILWVSAVVTLLLFVILLLYFRSITGAVLVILPVTIGILWTGGAVALIQGRLNIITSFSAVILAGLGSDYAIYILSRYRRERREGTDFQRACERAFSETGSATYLSMITTAGGFLALLFSKFSLFFEFGVVGAVGLLLNYAAIMLVLPAVLSVAERFRRRPPIAQESKVPASRWRARFGAFWMPRGPVAGVSFFLGLCVAGCLALPSVRVISFDDGQVESRSLPGYRLADRITPLFPLATVPTLLLVRGEEAERNLVHAAQEFLKAKGQDAVFNHVIGESVFLPDVLGKKAVLERILEKSRGLRHSWGKDRDRILASLESSLQAPPIARESLPPEVRRLFEARDGSGDFAVALNPAFGRVSAETMKRYRDGIREFEAKAGVPFLAVDNTFVSDDIIRLIEGESPRVFLFFLGVLGLVLFVKVKPLPRAALVFGSLVGSLLLLAAALWALGIRLNIINIAVIPVILGTAVDSFVHLGESLDQRGFSPETMANEVPAILVSNLTSLVGFGGLVLTSSAGLRSAGWVASLGILIVTLVCVYFYPRGLLLHRPKDLPAAGALGAADVPVCDT